MCDYRDTYIVVKVTITIEDKMHIIKHIKYYPLKIILHLDHSYQKLIHIYRQCRRSRYCYTNEQFVKVQWGSCSMTSGSSWNYYKDDVNGGVNEINADGYEIDNSTTEQLNILCTRQI